MIHPSDIVLQFDEEDDIEEEGLSWGEVIQLNNPQGELPPEPPFTPEQEEQYMKAARQTFANWVDKAKPRSKLYDECTNYLTLQGPRGITYIQSTFCPVWQTQRKYPIQRTRIRLRVRFRREINYTRAILRESSFFPALTRPKEAAE